MKSYTDISQSKKLSEILPIKSADMIYMPMMDIDSMSNSGFFEIPECYPFNEFKDSDTKPLPCWSLAALLGVLKYPSLVQNVEEKWFVSEWTGKHSKVGGLYDNPIDACYEMIVKLYEQKIL